MKRIFAVALIMIFSYSKIRADNVDESQARNVAATFMSCIRGETDVNFSTAKLFKTYINPATGDKSLYIYNIVDYGYVVVAGHTASTPVLAYNDEGVLTASDLVENRAFADWLQHYADMIALAQVKELPLSKKHAQLWRSLSEGVCVGVNLTETNNVSSEEQVTIYPNPSHKTINITLPSQTTSSNIVKIYNTFGKQIYNNCTHSNSISISIENFSKGMYILCVNEVSYKIVKI